ncbi:hypothetical protein ATK17_3969 [Branchiibius hedensis]|uniref:Uncharacterized protein n=1 Tax=Branchiibius hedensis TaxID=672460 RepID=A0A2Y9BLU6_9MICO|nr:hypothetical protein [Branchiibius hedensis]PWJ22800.1 hypothetical protein ATK17_3969 [Branchiibius hedensis]SSA59149.1 hypothetical protein SAMN04489750_3969 [Branchiibius hedensis]
MSWGSKPTDKPPVHIWGPLHQEGREHAMRVRLAKDPQYLAIANADERRTAIEEAVEQAMGEKYQGWCTFNRITGRVEARWWPGSRPGDYTSTAELERRRTAKETR